MKISKLELAKKINQLKGVVPKSDLSGALQGVLVHDGYLIASNTELTVKAKLEGVNDESFVIPQKAFDLIVNLPAGDVDIHCENETVTIQMGNIKNKFKTHPVEKFVYNRESIENEQTPTVSADKLKTAISHVIYAVPAKSPNKIMEGMYFKCTGGKLNLVGLDGHRIAWDSIDMDGEYKMIIPRAAVEKILPLDMQGDVSISHDAKGALFKTDEYEIYTRLTEGEYFKYESMFSDGDILTAVDRKSLMDSINRARLCGSMEDKSPVIMHVTESRMNIAYKNQTADYSEDVPTQMDVGTGLKIAFNPVLILDCIKAFDCENVSISFSTAKTPAIIRAEDSDMTSLVLPVNFKEN